MRTIKMIMCMMIVSATFLPFAAQGYEGRVLHTDSSMVTVKILQLDEDLTGATVEMTYMAGMLPMAIGSFKVKSCLLGVVALAPVSVTMSPSKDMKVILDLVSGMEGRNKASHGPVTGTVTGLDNDNVKIEIAGHGEIEPGSRADLFYKSSSGEEIPVGEWKVIKVIGNQVLAEPVKMIGDPMPGLVAKITTREKRKPEPVKISEIKTVVAKKEPDIFITSSQDKLSELDNLGSKELTVKKEKFAQKSKLSLEQAATQGDARAQNKLGWNYQKGINVNQDHQKAIFWYKKSAAQGNKDAQNSLGFMYDKGLGVTKDAVQAVYWYRTAADQGYACAQDNLGWMYQNGSGVGKSLTQAVSWYRKSALQGYTNSQNNLGWMYQNGLGIDQNYEQALVWYKKAAEKGDRKAQNNLGYMYQKGLGVSPDRQTAVFWYKKAAENGNEFARNNLKNMGENF